MNPRYLDWYSNALPTEPSSLSISAICGRLVSSSALVAHGTVLVHPLVYLTTIVDDIIIATAEIQWLDGSVGRVLTLDRSVDLGHCDSCCQSSPGAKPRIFDRFLFA